MRVFKTRPAQFAQFYREQLHNNNTTTTTSVEQHPRRFSDEANLWERSMAAFLVSARAANGKQQLLPTQGKQKIKYKRYT